MDYFIVVVILNFSFLIRFTDFDFAIRNYKTWSDLIEFQHFNTSILEINKSDYYFLFNVKIIVQHDKKEIWYLWLESQIINVLKHD